MASTATIQPAWTLQSLNTAQVGRYHDGVMVPSSTLVPTNTYRSGVVFTASSNPSPWGNDFGVAQSTTPAMSVLVGPGYAALARSGDAPYAVVNTNNQTLTVATADPTNPRLDLVYLQVLDSAAGDASTITQVGIVTGTPAGTPVLPNLPSTGVCIKLGQVAVAANASSIVNANITDLRTSTSMGGFIRLLSAADSLTSAGNRVGEQRQRVISGYPNTPVVTDVWGTDGNWHGTRSFSFAATSYPTSAGTYSDTSAHTLAQTVIPDPGYAYTLDISGHTQADNYSGSITGLVTVVVGGTTIVAPVPEPGPATWITMDVPGFTDTTVRTGSTTVKLNFTGGSGTSWTFNGNDGGTWLSVKVIPA